MQNKWLKLKKTRYLGLKEVDYPESQYKMRPLETVAVKLNEITVYCLD